MKFENTEVWGFEHAIRGMREFTSEEIKSRLSNIGEAIGNIALEYITKIEEENEQLVKYCKELEAGFLNYKKNYKTKRQKVFDLETRVRNFEKENERLKKYNTELCERLEAVAKESGKALTRQIIAESMVADLQKEKVVWHDLRKNPNDLPKVDMLVRVRLSSGMEHICETDYYEPSEDEIGYGKLIISFYELNGKWIDDTEIIAWCEIPKFEVEE